MVSLRFWRHRVRESNTIMVSTAKRAIIQYRCRALALLSERMVYASLFCSYKACEFFIMFRVSWLNSESETDRYSDLHCSASVFSPIRS